jgi:hypothetical protein
MVKKGFAFVLALGLLATQAFADESSDASSGGFKLGFYGSIANIGLNGPSDFSFVSDIEDLDNLSMSETPMGYIGILFDLGMGLELGLGFGLARISMAMEFDYPGMSDRELNGIAYEFVPSISYQIGKTDLISYSAGLDFHLSSWSMTVKEGNRSTTIEPESFGMGLFPNFQLKAEIVKNFQVWLKTGLMIVMPSDIAEEDFYTISTTLMGTRTSVGVSFYL